MKKISILLILLIVLSASFCSKIEKTAEAKTKSVKWYTFNEGMAAAAASKKPVIVDFYADWCSWCIKMEEEVFTEKNVAAKLTSDFIMIRIDTESNQLITFKEKIYNPQEFSSAFEVTGLPTLLFIDKNGEPVTKIPGYMEADVFLKLLTFMSTECYSKNISFKDFQSGKEKCGK